MSHGDRCFDLHSKEPSPPSQLEHHNNYSIKNKKNYCLTVFPFNYRLSLSSRCVKVSQFGEQSEEVDASLCDRRSKARELSKCHIPCHDECAVTMWSTWSHCPEVGKSLMFMLLYTYWKSFRTKVNDHAFHRFKHHHFISCGGRTALCDLNPHVRDIGTSSGTRRTPVVLACRRRSRALPLISDWSPTCRASRTRSRGRIGAPARPLTFAVLARGCDSGNVRRRRPGRWWTKRSAGRTKYLMEC